MYIGFGVGWRTADGVHMTHAAAQCEGPNLIKVHTRVSIVPYPKTYFLTETKIQSDERIHGRST